MKVYEDKSQFGWANDNDIGETLIQQIIEGKKTATAAPRDLFSADELKQLYDSVSKPSTVIDKHERPRCNIKILDVFKTTFGAPDPRLVRGEGYGDDSEAFCGSHRMAWNDLVESGKLELNECTVLVVEIFELIRSE